MVLRALTSVVCLSSIVVLLLMTSAFGAPGPRYPRSSPTHTGILLESSLVGPHSRALASFTLTYTGLDPTAVSLSWSHTSDLVFDHYEVDLSTSGSTGPWHPIANITDPNTTAFGEAYLSPGTTYWYRVVDYANLLGTTTSNVLTVQQPSLPTLTASNATSSSVDLSWTNPATYGGQIAFVAYAVNESVSGRGYSTVATVTTVTTLSYHVTGLSTQTSYSFQIGVTDTCCGGTALRASSNVVTIVTPGTVGASAVAEPTITDAGQRVSFTCSATGGVPPFRYLWTFGDGANGSGSSTTYAYAAPGVYNVVCAVTDASGASARAALLVRVDPAPSLAVAAPHPAAAPGSWLNFSARPSGGSGTYLAIDWSFGDGAVASGSQVSHRYATIGNFTLNATVQDTNGGSARASLAVLVQKVSLVLVTPRVSGQSGVAFPFTAQPAGGAGAPYAVSWNFGDGSQATGPSVSHAYSIPGSYTVTATATDTLGASGSASTPALLVYNAIRVSIASSSSNPIPGTTVSLTAQVTGGSGNYTCVWNLGGAAPQSGCTVQHSWAQAGRYDVGLTVIDSRAGNASARATMTVGTPPPATGGAAHPTSNHYWVLDLLVVPAILLLWALSRRRRPSRTSVGGTAPPSGSPPASPSPRCGSCGAPLRSWMTTCPLCEEPLQRGSDTPTSAPGSREQMPPPQRPATSTGIQGRSPTDSTYLTRTGRAPRAFGGGRTGGAG